MAIFSQKSLSRSMAGRQLLLFDTETERDTEAEFRAENLLTEDLVALDPMNMTPMEALEKLAELKEKAKKRTFS